ncbi:hypothetical protein [Streptomyces sp. CNQ-509]|uniref:hypothetical protein n=1 Tax=Streptomyces sp. CNQ-509 TaxID=444103 RepID=UPI00069A998F|nr:hypothetical protein [Streptomyces sp. CNQ-509]
MGTVSAIPDNLYLYAGTCTKGAEQLQTWVRTVLAPALRAYQNGGGTCFVIDGQVAQQVAAAYYTDRDVKVVGLAFSQAGGYSVSGPGFPIRVDDKTVSAAFQKLQLNTVQQTQIDAGAALAKKMMGTKVTELSGLLEELRRHGKDPYFNAGFFNGLDGQQLEKAVTEISALVSAYSSGLLEGRVHQRVINQLARPVVEFRIPVSLNIYYTSAAQKMQFLDALAATPTAARHFVQSSNNHLLLRLFDSSVNNEPWWRGKLAGVFSAGTPTWPKGAQPPDGSTNLSYELQFAGHLPYPSVDPHGKKYNREQLAVLSWVELNSDIIIREARRYGIDPRAIVAAVAWEAMENPLRGWYSRNKTVNRVGAPWGQWPLPAGTTVAGRKVAPVWVGPGKVHFKESPLIDEVEGLGGVLSPRSLQERKAILATNEGSIMYIAAMQGAFAALTEKYPAYRNSDPHRNVPLLAHVFQGGGKAADLATWKARLEDPDESTCFTPSNDMAIWAADPINRKFLDDSLRPTDGSLPPWMSRRRRDNRPPG